MTSDTFQRKLTAILSADVVGYSRLMGEDEAATVKTLETYKGVMFSLIKQHRGRVVDSPGDNLLAEFGSVVDAVQCAVSIQKELQTRNADLPENRRMEFRIGINLGDVIEEDDRIYGDGVNIAARLEALADPGGICVSKTAFDHIESKLPFGYRFIGEQAVKNIPKPIGAYKVLMETRVVDEEEQKAKAPFRRKRIVLSVGVILILVIVSILYWNFYLRGPSIEPASVERMAYPLPDKPSIAVLPFDNLSGDPEQEYIGDGLSENIISALSVSSQLFVIARNSTFTYKGKAVDIRQVAEDLGVQYILEGSVQKSEERLRVTAQFIDALTGHHLWAEVYDREMNNLFDLQDEITKKIMVSLQVVLSGSEEVRVYAKSTDNLEAWKHYIKGVELFENFNEQDHLKARERFETALEFDPVFIAALSKLAETHVRDYTLEYSDSPLTSINRALEFAQKAVELDEQDPCAHSILGQAFLLKRQYEKAITAGKRAITLNPNYARGHVALAGTMHYSGRFEEAITLAEKAYRLNSNLTPVEFNVLATSYIFLERYEEALETIRRMAEDTPPGSRLEPLLESHFSWVYHELGREEEARAYMAEALKIKPDFSLENFVTEPYKDPAHLNRWLDALRKAGMPEKPPGAVQEKPSIAVLPFDDLSPEKDQEYFVLGLSEEILNSLTKIPNLLVTARTSSFAFKNTNKKVQDIAKDLGVKHILEGSVRKAGNSLRITTQLIRVIDGFHLWSETYDRELKDIFKIQEDIANCVADKLKLTLEAFQLLGGTGNIEAYELYLKTKGKRGENVVSGVKSTLEQIDKIIALDPEFALAWSLKAQNHILLAVYGPSDRSIEEKDAAKKAAQRASEIERDLGDGYIYLGYTKASNKEWIKAELDYRKAIRLNNEKLSGDNSFIVIFYSAVGNFKRVLELLDEMKRNDPKHPDIGAWYCITYGLLGDRQQADREYQRRNISMTKRSSDWYDRAITNVRLASGSVLSSDEIVSSNHIHNTLKEYLNSPEEGLMELRQIYASNENLSAIDFGIISTWAAYFGNYVFAMAAAEKSISIDPHNFYRVWFPGMREVRKLTRFKEFMREIDLTDYWKEYGWPDLCQPVGDDDFVCD